MASVTVNGKLIYYDRNNPLSLDIVQNFPIEWQRQYADYIEGEKDAWFMNPKYARLRSKTLTTTSTPVNPGQQQVYYTSAEDKAKKDAQRQELTSAVREALNSAGNAIAKIGEIGLSFSPFWWTIPAVKSGLSFFEGNVGEGFKEAAIGLLAPYAIGKGILYGVKGYNTISNIAAVTNKGTVLNRILHPILASKYGEVVSNYRKALGEEMFNVALPHLKNVHLYTKGNIPGYYKPNPGEVPYIEGLSKKVKGDDMWTLAHETGHAWDDAVGAMAINERVVAKGPYYHNLKVPADYKYMPEKGIDISDTRLRESEFTADVLASKFYTPKYTGSEENPLTFLRRYKLAKWLRDPVYNMSLPVYSENEGLVNLRKLEEAIRELTVLLKKLLDEQYRDLLKKWLVETKGERSFNEFLSRPDIQELNSKRKLYCSGGKLNYLNYINNVGRTI